MPQLFVPPSSVPLLTGAAILPHLWRRGIPTLGLPSGVTGGIGAVSGIADCSNLIAASPPTLLEQYTIYSYSIGWAAVLYSSVALAAVPNIEFELALLVNDSVAYVTSSEPTPSTDVSNTQKSYVASGSVVSDLVNPLRLGARDRLSLRIGWRSDEANDANGAAFAMIGTQLATFTPAVLPAGSVSAVPFESTISYDVAQLPASRRL